MTDGEQLVETDQLGESALYGILFRADEVAQETQDLLFLDTLFLLVLLEVVIELHQKQGLEITGLSRLGIIVHNALDAPLEIILEGQHIAIRGDGQKFVLQHELQILVLKKILDFAGAHLVHATDFLTYGVELGRGFVTNGPVGSQATDKARPGLGRQGKSGHQRSQARIALRIGVLETTHQRRGRLEHFTHANQSILVKKGQRAAQTRKNAGHVGKDRQTHVFVGAKMDGLADERRTG